MNKLITIITLLVVTATSINVLSQETNDSWLKHLVMGRKTSDKKAEEMSKTENEKVEKEREERIRKCHKDCVDIKKAGHPCCLSVNGIESVYAGTWHANGKANCNVNTKHKKHLAYTHEICPD